MTPVLELDHVRKQYRGDTPVTALHDISMRVDAGDFVAIVGPSGSGKSTLLNLLGALDPPTSGSVRISGVDVHGQPDDVLAAIRGRHVGFVFQSFMLIDSMTAEDNVASALLYRGVDRAERRRRARASLEEVGLEHRSSHRPPQLSGGERQRVAIARALVGKPALLLADEPTGNLDTATGTDIVSLFQTINQAGKTVVLITHDEAVAAVAKRRIRIRDGRIES